MGLGPHELTPAEVALRHTADLDGDPYLLLRDEGSRLVVVTLLADRLTIGRSPESDLMLHWDARVSRAHAQLEQIGGRWTVVDDGLSRNGSFRNDQRISGRVGLEDGDVLRFGETVVVFHSLPAFITRTDVADELATVVALTPGQRRVLIALCRPLLAAEPSSAPATNPEIAAELVLSVEGVRTQMRALFERFELGDLPRQRKRDELARRAIAAGLVTRGDL